MISIFWLALWLQMSAPAPCQSAKLYYNGVLADEEPHCGLLNQVINMPTALDDLTRAELSEAAQRAADETDGKPLSKLRCTIDAVTHKISPPECAEPDGKRNPRDIGPLPNYYDMRAKVCGVDDMKCVPIESAEPVDVPAVQLGGQLSYDCGQGIACIDHYIPIYSCKDKSRILEHDENSPPKYWCRKVQP